MRAATARALWQCHPTCTALLSLQQSVRSASLWGSTAQTQSPDTKPRSPDYIHLKGLVFHGYHGVLPEENLLGQKFVVDATLFVDLLKAGQSDNVHDTVSYADVYRHIKTVMEGQPHKLLESVAERLASEILNDYHQVQGLHVHIKKPHVAVTGVVESLGIEITRYRTQS
ncbi:hypothetical protein ABBQ38_000469 [Trebouxia sp. C0009 RCD-2024]